MKLDKKTKPINLGIVVLTFNEVLTLEKTVNEINELSLKIETKIIVSTSRNATPECIEMARNLEKRNKNVILYFQKEPFVAAAVLEAVELLDTNLIIYMSADGETPAEVIPSLIDRQIIGDFDVVSASRWIAGGSFTGYGFTKLFISFMAQMLCKIVFMSRLTEFTYGFRVYKREVLELSLFREKKHPFFLESLLIPLKLKCSISEVPVNWKPRTEGESIVDFQTLLSYIRPILIVRLSSRRSLIRSVR